jgi:hypothetical protein
MGPATKPCKIRKKTKSSSDGAKPHKKLVMTKSAMLVVKSLTAPKRWVNQPVKGTEIALATPKLVITQVP